MGNTCNGTFPHQQVTILQFRKQNSSYTAKRNTITDRFSHQIQKLKIDGFNMYKLILPVEGQRQQTKTIQCKFLFSYADMQMCSQYQFTLNDLERFPIIDYFQQQNIINPQIYHKITTAAGKRRLMKYYNFRSFSDYQFKKGIYQISLYQKLKSKSPLESYFIIYKGQVKQLVMIFKHAYVSLHDMLYYRRSANYQWDEKQLLMIAKMLCENYLQLSRVGIVHRDIRPSTIFFTPIGMVNQGLPRESNFNTPTRNVTNNQDQFNNDRCYQFINLESARVFDLDQDDDSDILTVKGVPVFTDNKIRASLQRQQHKANYNPYQIDMSGLKYTLLALINLQTINIQRDTQHRFKGKKKVQQLLKYLTQQQHNHQHSIQKLDIYIGELLGINHSIKHVSYYKVLKQFYTKQLTICQNIQSNLYYKGVRQASPYNTLVNNDSFNLLKSVDSRSQTLANTQINQSIGISFPSFLNNQSGVMNNTQVNNSFPYTNSQTMLNSTSNIQQQQQQFNNLSEQKISPKEYLQNLYSKTLFDLQMKSTFLPYMLQRLSKNFDANKRQDNVKLLLQVGKYFEDSGVRQNQYYRQAVTLLLELAEQQRCEGFFTDHNKFVNHAQEVFKKFQTQQSKIYIGLRAKILKEKAYRELYISSTDISSQLSSVNSSRLSVPYESDRGRIIRQYIDESIALSQKSNLPFEDQLDLIYSKGELAFLMRNLQQSQTFFTNGLNIAQKNYKEFKTYHNNNKFKGMFEYGLASVQLANVLTNRTQKKGKTIFNIQQKLIKSKQRFGSVTVHPIFVIKCYTALGDLFYLKQDAENSKINYERAINLIHAENNKEVNVNMNGNGNINTRQTIGYNTNIVNNNNSTNIHQARSVSAKIQLQIVQKLINVLQRTNYDVQWKKYQRLRQALRNQIGKPRKSQRRYSRSGRLSQKDRKSTYQHNQRGGSKLPMITEQQEQNRPYESSHRIAEQNNMGYSHTQNLPNIGMNSSNFNLNSLFTVPPPQNTSPMMNNSIPFQGGYSGNSNLNSGPPPPAQGLESILGGGINISSHMNMMQSTNNNFSNGQPPPPPSQDLNSILGGGINISNHMNMIQNPNNIFNNGPPPPAQDLNQILGGGINLSGHLSNHMNVMENQSQSQNPNQNNMGINNNIPNSNMNNVNMNNMNFNSNFNGNYSPPPPMNNTTNYNSPGFTNPLYNNNQPSYMPNLNTRNQMFPITQSHIVRDSMPPSSSFNNVRNMNNIFQQSPGRRSNDSDMRRDGNMQERFNQRLGDSPNNCHGDNHNGSQNSSIKGSRISSF